MVVRPGLHPEQHRARILGRRAQRCLLSGGRTSAAAVGLYSSFDPVADVQFQDPLLANLADGAWSSVQGGMPFGIPHGLFNVSSVSCPTLAFCRAAGTYSYDTDLAMTWDWTPAGWTDYVIPLSSQIDFNVIVSSVSCSDPDDCVVVGSYVDSSYSPQALIVTYTSGAWTAMEAPLPANATSPGGGTGTALDAIDCPQPDYCVAAGRYTDASLTVQPLLDVLSSGVWSPAEGPVPADAVGYQAATISGVYCPTEGTCVAAGEFGGSNGYAGMILSQSGSAWSAADAPLPQGLMRAIRPDGSLPVETATAATTSLAGVGCDASGFCASGGTDGSFSLEETGQLPGIPTVTGITPDVGASGSLVTVGGANFSPSSQVVFGATAASTTVVSSTELQAVVPSAIACGTSVTVSSGGLLSRDEAADLFVRAGCTPPGPPSKVKAVPGNGRATVTFRAPSATGGEAPGSYEVVATDLTSSGRGGQRVDGTSSPIAVTGLMRGDVYSFAVSAANTVGSGPMSPPSNVVTLAIAPLIIVSKSLPAARTGRSYSKLLKATGGYGSLTWSITAGALPSGLQLSTTGQISGTVATGQSAGSFPFTVSVSDLRQPTADSVTASFVLRVR